LREPEPFVHERASRVLDSEARFHNSEAGFLVQEGTPHERTPRPDASISHLLLPKDEIDIQQDRKWPSGHLFSLRRTVDRFTVKPSHRSRR
jgi:hypothetical protein